MTGSPLNTNHGNSHGNGWSWVELVFEVFGSLLELVGAVFECLAAFF
ncbi:MAG TPA: hypothetical protein VFZ59_21800 [Verrucomicrobiae bacterium]|nr:hypothetical protein [Verrucomicrobiae bacterium]